MQFQKHIDEWCISNEGMQKMLNRNIDPRYPAKDLFWTDDYKVELPIKLSKTGINSYKPTTIMQEFKKVVESKGDLPAVSQKINGKWLTINYRQYYAEAVAFAKGLIAMKVPEFMAVNIIGFNSREWFFAFHGSMMARCVPVGVYTTNTAASCEYIAIHSESRVVLAENRDQAQKYFGLLRANKMDLVIIYNDQKYEEPEFEGRIIQYKKFILNGQRVDDRSVDQLIQKVKPGNCCTLVYTSGTTGMPKGVMLSHDNYTWAKQSLDIVHEKIQASNEPLTIISYLPLSHVAGQYTDMVASTFKAFHVYIADSTALQGSLINYLREIRPQMFLSVPRVWQKIYDQMMEIAKSNGVIKTAIATWAKKIGAENTLLEVQNKPTSWQFKMAKMLVYNRIKEALGLDQCKFFFFGAAPLDPVIRKYFLSLNIFLINSYGMSESTGPQNFTDQTSLTGNDLDSFRQVGRKVPGSDLKILKANEADDDGELCYRGRHIFMGYFKNPEETNKTIDSEGYLHSGDNGKITADGTLFITGRSKELIVTGGGENIPPILIENQIKGELPCVSNVMLIGDMRKYLTCLITLREDPPNSGKLAKVTSEYLSLKGVEVKSVQDARQSPKVKKILIDGLKRANDKAISKAQHVQDCCLLGEDFSVENELLTPTMKLKRKEVLKRYAVEIEALYTTSKL